MEEESPVLLVESKAIQIDKTKNQRIITGLPLNCNFGHEMEIVYDINEL